jgi:hypothetical protein
LSSFSLNCNVVSSVIGATASSFVPTVSFTSSEIVTNPCFFGVAQLLLRFIYSDVYAQNRIFATTLALIGIWEQLVLCDCAERDTAVDDVAHSFTMVRRVTRFVLLS